MDDSDRLTMARRYHEHHLSLFTGILSLFSEIVESVAAYGAFRRTIFAFLQFHFWIWLPEGLSTFFLEAFMKQSVVMMNVVVDLYSGGGASHLAHSDVALWTYELDLGRSAICTGCKCSSPFLSGLVYSLIRQQRASRRSIVDPVIITPAA